MRTGLALNVSLSMAVSGANLEVKSHPHPDIDVCVRITQGAAGVELLLTNTQLNVIAMALARVAVFPSAEAV